MAMYDKKSAMEDCYGILPVITTNTRGEYKIYKNIHYKDRSLPASAWTCESAVMPLWYEQRRGPFIQRIILSSVAIYYLLPNRHYP